MHGLVAESARIAGAFAAPRPWFSGWIRRHAADVVDPRFPSMKARQLRRVLEGLGYAQVRKTGGSHRRMKAPGRPAITFAFHDRETVAPGLVHAVLCKQVGLDIEQALALL